MKKIKFLILAAYLSFLEVPVEAVDISAEFRAAAFIHSSKKFKALYGDVGPCYAIELGVPVYCPFDAWVNVDWFHRNKRHDCISKSSVNIFNASFGIKYVYTTCNNLNLYLGIGPSFGGICLKNKSDAYRESSSKFIAGAVLKSGIDYTFFNGVFLDAFVDYLYQPVRFHKRVDIGGAKIGLGIGYQF